MSQLWRYLPHQGDLEMYFGFYDNFTPDDIICKVFSSWKELYRGMGASVQFNAGRCMTVSCLCHHGDVTVGKRISRSHLVSLIQTICPREMGMAGILGSWPVTIGDTTNIPRLIDQLFVYAYCIEQAKRYIRGEAPMLPLPQIKTPLVI